MHILLTDLLACPRCGPEYGLVLLADRVENRRVLEGRLGCPNCREQYRVNDGVVDLRSAALAPLPEAPPAGHPEDDDAQAVRVAALLGLAQASGTVLLAGALARLAPALAGLLPEVEVVACTPDAAPTLPAERVTWIRCGARLPFRSGVLRGAALAGIALDPAEGLRVVQPGGRVVLEGVGGEGARALEAAGAQLLLDQEGIVVARAVGEPVQLRLNTLR